MSSKYQVTNVEIEDKVVLNALISTLKSNENLVSQLRDFILNGTEVIDTRNEVEQKRSV